MLEQNNVSSDDQNQDKREVPGQNVEAMPILIILIIVGAIAIIIYALQASSLNQILSVSTVGILTGGACLLVGSLVGFIFGIPRSLQRNEIAVPTPGNDDSRSVAYEANTNLEQISDWLTKILVGVGLTQLSNISDSLQTMAEFLAGGLGNFSSSKAFALAILVFYSVSGFLLGYLWTRLRLAGAFRRADVEGITQQFKRVSGQLEVMKARQAAQDLDITNPRESKLVDEQLDQLLKHGEVLAAIQVGRTYLKVKQFDRSLAVFRYLENRVERTNKYYRKIMSNMGYSLIGLQEYREAIRYLEGVEDLAGGRYFRVWHAIGIAYAYYQLNQPDQYRQWLSRAQGMSAFANSRDFFAALYPEIAGDLLGRNVDLSRSDTA